MSDFNNLSDEDFLKESEPTVTEDLPVGTSQPVDEPVIIETNDPVDEPPLEDDLPTDEDLDNPKGNEEEIINPPSSEPKPKTDTELLAEDPVAFYEKLTGKIKAAGKEVQFKNSDEIILAIQQGVDYTRKTQDLAKDRKIVSTLKKHNISESQLSYAIDLLNKDPNAIKKLIKESEIDMMELASEDLDNPSIQYQGSNHIISDEELNFNSAVETLKKHTRGAELSGVIAQEWDEASKDFLWNNPNVINVLLNHVDSGVYDQIISEMDRRSILGISGNEPYMKRYQDIGNELFGSTDQPAPQPTNVPVRTPIATGTSKQTDYKGAPNTTAASAASPRTNSSSSQSKTLDISKMSDEELMKNASKIEAQFGIKN